MEMVRRINHKAPHYYMRQCPQLACNTESSIEMPAHLSILPVAQRFLDFARNDDTRVPLIYHFRAHYMMMRRAAISNASEAFKRNHRTSRPLLIPHP